MKIRKKATMIIEKLKKVYSSELGVLGCNSNILVLMFSTPKL